MIVALFGIAGSASANEKVLVCHNTGSDSNPAVKIKISINALNAHLKHGDAHVVPECEGVIEDPGDDDGVPNPA